MVDFNAALVKKIVRMLESEHDGERAAAASKLNSMAKAGGKNIDEILAAVYGGGAQHKPDPRNDARPKPGRPSWGNEWGGGNFQDPPYGDMNSFAEAVRRAHEAAARQQREYESAAHGGLLDKLRAEMKQWGESMLTVWEQDFVSGIFDWKGALTRAQEVTIERILEKYAAYAKRSGEAESFWKA
jgi:hypothetical protein